MIKRTISHYKILEKIGEGGMGVVYKAQDTTLDRIVALKFLPKHLLCDEEAKARFVQEAKAASALNHPNITTIYEIDEVEGECFISMEYIEGKSIKELVEEKGFSIEEILKIAIQTAEGLSKAHQKGIVHRDIKSDNIMLTDDGLAKIMDFGLAKLKGVSKVTKAGTTLGTVSYMSPEQARGEEVDHRTDIWSLGVVLYEMLTGELPFKGEYEQAVIYTILNEEPKPITDFRTDLPGELEPIVSKALSKNSDSRYHKAGDILVDLRKLRKELESDALKEKVSSTKAQPSVAVLPFVNITAEKENEYFSDGITEDIIAQLSKIGDLKVISRTSIMRYKKSDKSLREIGKELSVGTILEGSVRRAGDRVRIVGQLVDARTDKHIWAETYDRELKDIFAIQSDVAQKIAIALKAKLSPEEKERLERKPTENLTAYDYYLKGREYYNHYKKQDNENAIRLFKKALELDPAYALAYAGLGDAYAQRTIKFGFAPTWLDSTIEVSQKAISVDPGCAQAHKALGLAYFGKGWVRKALEANLKAVELNPNYHPAVANIGWGNLYIGESEEALKWMKKAVALDPTDAYFYYGVGVVYMILDDYAQGELWINKALELQPDFIYTHFGLIHMHLAQGKYDQATAHSRKILSIAPDNPDALSLAGYAELISGNYAQAKQYYEKIMEISPTGSAERLRGYPTTYLAYIYWKTDQGEEARKMLGQSLDLAQKQLKQGDESWVPPYNIAVINAVQGNKKEACVWLQKAIDAGWRDYRIASIDPVFENLHNDEKFRQMMAEVKAMVDEMRKRVEEMEKK